MSPASVSVKDLRHFQISPLQSDLLDLSRWLAALLVVLAHLRGFIFKPPQEVAEHMGFLWKTFYLATGFGHSSVMVFFVMSGFLVGGKVLERLASGEFSWSKYLVDRGSRLYAVYLLALILGGALDYFGSRHLNSFGLYDQSFPGKVDTVAHDFQAALSVPVLAVNMGMCQTVLGPVFGSNEPLWSLANEFWYYLAGPLLFFLLYPKGRRRWFVHLFALAGLGWFLPTNMRVFFLVWLMGAALYFVNGRLQLPLWMALILFFSSMCSARFRWLSGPFIGDFLIGLTFALLILAVAGSSRRLPGHALSRKAADFSYSVYLCHFPLVVFLLSALYQLTGVGLQGQPGLLLLALLIVVLLFAYLYSYLISLVTERQTRRIRETLYRLLDRIERSKGKLRTATV